MKNFFKGVIIGYLALTALCLMADTFFPKYEVSYVQHTVQHGQTLWEIAELHFPKQRKCSVLDEYLYEVCRANHWKRMPMLHPGDKVVVPLWKEVEQ